MEKGGHSYSRSLSYYTWEKLKGNGLAMTGLALIVLASVIALFGSLLRPDQSLNANEQYLPLSKKRPGFEVKMLKVTQPLKGRRSMSV